MQSANGLIIKTTYHFKNNQVYEDSCGRLFYAKTKRKGRGQKWVTILVPIDTTEISFAGIYPTKESLNYLKKVFRDAGRRYGDGEIIKLANHMSANSIVWIDQIKNIPTAKAITRRILRQAKKYEIVLLEE